MRYLVDKETIWEDTGKIIVHNFPAKKNTYSYITKIYREYKFYEVNYKEFEGEPIYFDELSEEQRTLAIIIGNAQNTLSNNLKNLNYPIWNG